MKKSWEAELIISGGFLFSLITLSSEIPEVINQINYNYTGFVIIFSITGVFLNFGIDLLIFGFSCHLLFRMSWLAYNGVYILESAQNKDGKEGHVLDKAIDSRKWVDRLNRISGITFSISALALFLIISFSIWMTILVFIGYVLNRQYSWSIYLWFTYVFISFPYLLNFLSLHRLSRTKFYRFYRPINEFLSAITLSMLYRPLTRRIMAMANWKFGILMNVALVIGLLFSTNFRSARSILYDQGIIQKSSFTVANSNSYTGGEEFARLSIQGYAIEDSYLKIRLIHPVQNEELMAVHADLKVSELQTLSNVERMKLVSNFYKVYLDNEIRDVEYFYNRVGGFTNFNAVLPLDSLSPGIHQLLVTQPIHISSNLRRTPLNETLEEFEYGTISFYYLPN